MTRQFTYSVAALLLASFCPISLARSETVELLNGDVVHGKVLSLDARVLKLRSESFGELSIKRESVASIHLSDKRVRPSRNSAKNSEKPPGNVLERVPSPDEVLEQLRATGGISAQDLKAVQQKFPLLATPEVSGYVTERISGLLSGKLDLLDIRKEAVDVVDQIKDLQKDLGPQASALNGYLSILESFINETTPKDERKPGNTDKPSDK